MKNIYRSVTKLLLITTLFAGMVHTELLAQDKILVTAAAPTTYAKKDGVQLTGPVIEIANRVFQPLNIQVETVAVPWKRALKMLKTGQVDAVLTILFNPERAEYALFTEPYRHIESSVFVNSTSNLTFQTWDDLKGLKGVRYRGTTEGTEFDRYADEHLNIKDMTTQESMLKMVAAGRIDYGFTKRLDILEKSTLLGIKDQITVLPKPISRNPIYFAISKKSPYAEKIDQINQQLIQLRDSGEIEALFTASLTKAK